MKFSAWPILAACYLVLAVVSAFLGNWHDALDRFCLGVFAAIIWLQNDEIAKLRQAVRNARWSYASKGGQR